MTQQQQTSTNQCYKHGNPSHVRCGKCDRPVCPRCMVHGPVGVRCLECGKPTKMPQYTVPPVFLLRAIAASLPLAVAGSVLITVVIRPYLFGFLHLLALAGLGALIGQVAGLAANRKKGRSLQIVAVGSLLVGDAVSVYLLSAAGRSLNLFDLLGMGLGIYVAYQRLT